MTDESTGKGEWARPQVELVSPGVYRVPLPLPHDGLRAVNVYILLGADADDGAVLIDSGWSIPEARSLLAASLRGLDRSEADIRRFLVTHVHRDHYTQAIAIRRDHQTPVALGLGERESLTNLLNEQPPLAPQLDAMRRMGAGVLADQLVQMLAASEDDSASVWGYPDEWLTPGLIKTEVGRTLEVVHTPGHTRGHVVFHDLDTQLLFAGDHVLPTITPSIGLESVSPVNPLGAFLGALAVVRSRPDAVLLPAHGPVTPSVHARVDELIAHHGRRLDETEKFVNGGATTGLEVASALRWTRRLHSLGDLDIFNAMLAIGETGAHLDLLVAQGRLQASDIDGVRRYQPV